MDILEEKARLRKEMLRIRAALSKEESESASRRIAERLAELDLSKRNGALLTYVSMGHEVDTRDVIGRWIEEAREVYVPPVAGEALLRWSRLLDPEDLRTGALGTPEPKDIASDSSTLPPRAVVLVPGVAFSSTGARLGRGSGYFDRFLSGYRGTKVGLAFDLQIVRAIPEEGHDQRMDLVITESRVYHCRGGGET